MLCIDEPYDIFGDFNSRTASNLMVTFELCDESVRKCKPRDQIMDVLANSYMVVLENEEYFAQDRTPAD